MIIRKMQLMVLSIFIVSYLATAQTADQTSNFGMTLNLGASKVTNSYDWGEYFKTNYAFSGSAGIFYEEKLGTRSFIGFEALLLQLEGKEGRKNHELTQYNPVSMMVEVSGTISDIWKFHSYFFTLSCLVGVLQSHQKSCLLRVLEI